MSNKPNATLAWAGDELQCNGVTVARVCYGIRGWFCKIVGKEQAIEWIDRADAVREVERRFGMEGS